MDFCNKRQARLLICTNSSVVFFCVFVLFLAVKITQFCSKKRWIYELSRERNGKKKEMFWESLAVRVWNCRIFPSGPLRNSDRGERARKAPGTLLKLFSFINIPSVLSAATVCVRVCARVLLCSAELPLLTMHQPQGTCCLWNKQKDKQ